MARILLGILLHYLAIYILRSIAFIFVLPCNTFAFLHNIFCITSSLFWRQEQKIGPGQRLLMKNGSVKNDCEGTQIILQGYKKVAGGLRMNNK